MCQNRIRYNFCSGQTYCLHHSNGVGVQGWIEPLHGEARDLPWSEAVQKESLRLYSTYPHSVHDKETAVQIHVLSTDCGTSYRPHKSRGSQSEGYYYRDGGGSRILNSKGEREVVNKLLSAE